MSSTESICIVDAVVHDHVDVAHYRGAAPLAGKHDRALVLMGFVGGFRRSELTSLKVGSAVDGSTEEVSSCDPAI